jgi:hypothetical protein
MSTPHTYSRFFITGLPRTGTTWMMSLVNQITGICCYGESKLYSSAVRDTPSLASLLINTIRPWAQIIARRKHNIFRADNVIHTIERENVVPEQTVAKAIEITAMAALRGITDCVLVPDDEETVVVGEKTPQMYPAELELIAKAEAEAFIVIMRRNVYDWIVSWARFYYTRRCAHAAEWMCIPFTDDDYLHLDRVFHSEETRFLPDGTLEKLARRWSEYEACTQRLGGREHIMVIDYEVLIRHTKAVLAEILDCLIKYDPAEIDMAVAACDIAHQNRRAVMSSHINAPEPGRNKELLSERDIRVIAKAMGWGG